MKVKISIIIPVYNVERYLKRCVDSILNQTFTDYEIILVNDGSTDNSGKICDEYSKKNNRIKVVHKENGGLSSARNAGISQANGEFIMFVDSDDYISHRMVEFLYNSLIENNSDIALCNFLYVDEYGNELENENIHSPIKNEVLTSNAALKRISGTGSWWYYVVAWNKLYKKELFDTIQFPYGKCHEDEFVAHKIFDKCRIISCVEEPLYFYVQRTDSIMNQNYSVKRLDAVEAYADRILLFLEKGMYNSATELFSVAVSSLATSYSRLDLSRKDVFCRIKELQAVYRKIYTSSMAVFIKEMSVLRQIRAISFVTSIRLHILMERVRSSMF